MGADTADLQALAALPFTLRQYGENQTVLRDGETPSECCLIADVRSKTIADGRRQILSIHIPGDLPNLQNLHYATMDHDLVALSDCTLAFVGHKALKDLISERPSVGDIFWRDTLVDAAVSREWIVNVGQRSTYNRLAHLIVELRERLRLVGRVIDNTFAIPLTQEQLGEAGDGAGSMNCVMVAIYRCSTCHGKDGAFAPEDSTARAGTLRP